MSRPHLWLIAIIAVIVPRRLRADWREEFGVTPLMKSLLFGISPLDPLTLMVAPVLLLLAALVACSVPAHRAARADPKIALRYERCGAICPQH
jgi:ABC-type lipoprotein release transport system permease subunit